MVQARLDTPISPQRSRLQHSGDRVDQFIIELPLRPHLDLAAVSWKWIQSGEEVAR
jgi:hypothetical protein